MSESPLPRAVVVSARGRVWAIALPLIALAVALWIGRAALAGRGPLVTIKVEDGHGLKSGDPLRYRGIGVGRIEEVRLQPDLSGVILRVRLDRDADEVARRGSRFWVVRPTLSLEGVKGLETVVGARYLTVLPGPSNALRQSEFVALEEPPLAEALEAGGLELTLEGSSRFGLAAGAALTYRGIRVGTVLAVGLSSDATGVEVRAYIRPPYVQLVRENTRFWEDGGLEVDLALLEGLHIDVSSLASLLVGSIALATPTDAGSAVRQGHRFHLESEAQKEWLGWKPALPVGRALAGGPLPLPIRAHLSWTEDGLLRRSRGASGWLLPVDGGLIGPAELLAPKDARQGTVELELLGQVLPLDVGPVWMEGGVARLPLAVQGARAWSFRKHRQAVGPEDSLVVVDATVPPRALAAAKLAAVEGAWQVDNSLVFGPEWQGACVVGRSDGQVLGILIVAADGVRVALLPEAP